ncbi:MAG: hypothetical protein M3Y57_11560 [Acidobacteriota bacterium]|nr:hypothetical protein [Acidobacteriota bacterium]
MPTWEELRVSLVVAVLAAVSLAQTAPNSARPRTGNLSVYEDDEVRIIIPAGWSCASGNYPSLEPYRVGGAVVAGNSVLQADGRLLLQKDGYTLALVYRTQHASGAVGGRFIEAFDIPWLDPDQALTCSFVLTHLSQPANRTVLFRNMLMNTGIADVRAKCGIPKDLGKWAREGVGKQVIGERRWYGGYFTRNGGYFFDESGDSCESKVYSLTSAAKTPAALPDAGDQRLLQIIEDAIDIVDSIQYKRCAPKP